MLKKLLTLAAVLLLVSCSGKSKSESEEYTNDNFQIDNQAQDTQPSTPYQTLSDEQQAVELNQQSNSAEIEVQDRVLFTFDSSELSPEAKTILDSQIAWLKSDANLKVIVEGHCDERGTREYNIALGERRANSAKNYLVNGGIDSSRVKTISYGKERPAFFGTSDEIMSKNRRAVTVVQ